MDAIIQQMYDRGYVLVDLDDMVDKTTDENGTVHVTAKNIMLRCVRGSAPSGSSMEAMRKARREYDELKAFWNVHPSIDAMGK